MQKLLEYVARSQVAMDEVLAVFSSIVTFVDLERVGEISSRLKTFPAIARKLARRPTMKLTQMQDIAGCRGVFSSQEQVDTAIEALLTVYPDARVVNRVERPARTGYRAKHVIVKEFGCPVEIQLRTESQSSWADTVERFGIRFGLTGVHNSLKDGDGPDVVVRYFEVAAEMLHTRETASPRHAQAIQDLTLAREDLRAWHRAGRPS